MDDNYGAQPPIWFQRTARRDCFKADAIPTPGCLATFTTSMSVHSETPVEPYVFRSRRSQAHSEHEEEAKEEGASAPSTRLHANNTEIRSQTGVRSGNVFDEDAERHESQANLVQVEERHHLDVFSAR
jgi:hypothetical protein